MKNIIKYIKKYGDVTFLEKTITEVDVLIFSLIPYINFKNVVLKNDEISLFEAWEQVEKYNTKAFGFAQETAFKTMRNLYGKKRYKELVLKKYVYFLSIDTQFCAITIKIPNNYTYVVFEGTDDDLCGWKEDFMLTYVYPTESQKMAIKYLNNIVKISGPDVVICGHSKGGNLALVSAMNLNFFKKKKIKKIYSFDGPGLKEEEFNSFNYKVMKKRLVNIVPNLSLVGVLLEQEKLNVIKSNGIGILQHDPITWVVDDDKFKVAEQDKLSKKMHIAINKWLSKYNYKEREEIVDGIFGLFETANIKKLSDIRMNKLQSIYKLIKVSQNLSNETKEVIMTSIKLLAIDFKEELKNNDY